jgi:hypothetical protein
MRPIKVDSHGANEQPALRQVVRKPQDLSSDYPVIPSSVRSAQICAATSDADANGA